MEKGYEMDLSEATKTILRRIQRIEPELAPKIIEYLLLKVYGDQEVIRMAFGPDLALRPLISEAKAALSGCRLSVPVNGPPEVHPHVGSYPPTGSADSSSSLALCHSAPPFWDLQTASESQRALPNLDLNHEFPLGEDNPAHCGKLMCCSYFREYPANGHPKAASMRRSMSMAERSPRVCHYYQKGYCKHGANCRYIHGGLTANARELGGEDQVISPGSLEALEVEIANLLRSRKGQTISISVLPTMYSNMYGKPLEADGYLTESQRHGKPGYNLTTLLARLKNIRIVDRPHGQHSVMLAEDGQKCVDLTSAGNDSSSNVSGSQRIYLTFPSDSSFNEDDVANYFRRYGRVLDVRIPAQHKRMFGFVTFESQETVKLILSKPNTHYVCGFRVLAKPYKEKFTINDRKFSEKFETCAPHCRYFNSDSDAYSTKRFFENSPELFKKHILEEQEHDFELLTQGEPSGFSCLTNDVSDDSLSNGRHQILGKNNGKQPLNEWDEEHYRFQALGESSGFSCLVSNVNDDFQSNGKHQILGKKNGKQPLNEWDEEHYKYQTQGESSGFSRLATGLNNGSPSNGTHQLLGTNNGQ